MPSDTAVSTLLALVGDALAIQQHAELSAAQMGQVAQRAAAGEEEQGR